MSSCSQTLTTQAASTIGTESSMVAKLQEIKSEKKLKASGDDENSQKRLSGDFPRSDKTDNLGSSGGLAPELSTVPYKEATGSEPSSTITIMHNTNKNKRQVNTGLPILVHVNTNNSA